MVSVLIIGLGNIGKAHLFSIINKKNIKNIDIVEKKDISFLFFSKKIKKILFKDSLNKKYDLIIVATSSYERFAIINKLVQKKNYKYILCEKFIFTKKEHYKKVFINKNIYINSWGKKLFNLIKKKINHNSNLNVTISKNSLATNSIHVIDFFLNLTGFNKLEIESQLILIKSKRKNYHELDGNIKFINNLNYLFIQSSKKFKLKKFISIKFLNSDNFCNFEIYLDFKKKTINLIKQNIIQKIPINKIYVKNTTSNLIENLNKKYLNNNFSSYENLSEISADLVSHLNNTIGKKIRIT